MSDIIRITSNNSVITFDFDNEKIGFLRSSMDKMKGRQDLVLPFSAITGIEVEKATTFLMGSVCFIADNIRFSCLYDGKKHIGEALMYQCNKKEYPTLEVAVSALASKLNLPVKAKGAHDVPTLAYDGRYAQTGSTAIEYRRKCNVCGKVFCFNDKDIQNNVQHAKAAATSSVMQIGEALAGTRIGAYAAQGNAANEMNRIVDYSKCPYCNSSDISELSKEEFEKASREATATPTVQAAPASAADELKKFKELLDMGVISQAEFDAKKKQLLGL